jgi:hypothetical protein
MALILRTFLVITFVACFSGYSRAETSTTDDFLVGVYGDRERTVTCVTGLAGATFELSAWAFVPNDLGLAYVTLRFEFPPNLDLSARPEFHDLVQDFIISDFPDGTVEWNMLVVDCPSGWFRVFTQECELLDEQTSLLGINGDHSMLRDCDFFLNDVRVVNELLINDPDCPLVPARPVTWSSLKGAYR